MGWTCTKCGYSTRKKISPCPNCGNEQWRFDGVKNRKGTAGSIRGPKGKLV